MKIIATTITIINSIHSGESTHIHDQLIFPKSFNATNKIVNKEAKPPPSVTEHPFLSMVNPLCKKLLYRVQA